MNLSDILLTVRANSSIPMRIKYFYDANTRVSFMGFADVSALTSASKWRIVKTTYNANNTPDEELSSPIDSVLDDKETYFP